MIMYSGYQWLLIEIAGHFGLDKLTFDKRIQWSEKHLDSLETMAIGADDKPLYEKAVMALRKAQQGIATGHLVGVDASASGIQIMSALTGCIAGATATNLVDPTVRNDAYSILTNTMNDILGGNFHVSRPDAKDAMMKSFYGSKAEPIAIFGEETPELNAYYKAAYQIAPGPWELLQDLLASWQPYALLHEWKLPDGYDARVKVMTQIETRVEVDELDHATFTYVYYVNEGEEKGLSNAANVIHSVDAYILRSMHRRCNYDAAMVAKAAEIIELELLERHCGGTRIEGIPMGKAGYYVEQYKRSNLADITILPFINDLNVRQLSYFHLMGIASIVKGMLQYKPFELVTIHDEFKCHPNNVNWVRWQYKEILADLADSNTLNDLLSQLYGNNVQFNMFSDNLGDVIRNSEYALC